MENVTDEGFPTTVKLDFFSGYTFVGITEPFGKANANSGWMTESRYNFALIHLKKVSNCIYKNNNAARKDPGLSFVSAVV